MRVETCAQTYWHKFFITAFVLNPESNAVDLAPHTHVFGHPEPSSMGAASAQLSGATISLCQGLKTRVHTVMEVVMVNLLSGRAPYFYACGRSYFWKTFSESLRGLNVGKKSTADYCKDIIEYGTKDRPSSRSF